MAQRLSMILSAWVALVAFLGSAVNGLEIEDIGDRAMRLRSRSSHLKIAPRHTPKNETCPKFESDGTAPFKVDELPDIDYYFPELYSGQIPIDKNTNRNMFFVFNPKVGDPVDEVTIWFNGGPGCSSLEGFLQENGPYIWTWGQYSGLPNPYSWVNLTNMLWVEFPVGLGFSTGTVNATSQEEVAQDFLGFFKNFQEIFGIKNYKIYVTGESYAGRYVPYVSDAMLQTNNTENFNLKGALMYDPVIGKYDYVGQTVVTVPYVEKYSQFLNFNKTFLTQLRKAHQDCGYADYLDKYLTFPASGVQPVLTTPYQQNPGTDACNVWSKAHRAAFQPNPCFNVYEISSTCPLLFDPLAFPTDLAFNYPGFDGPYFNRTAVKRAMHAPLNVSWAECSGSSSVFRAKNGTPKGQYGNYDFSIDPIQKVLPRVIESTNRVLIASADWDFELINDGTLLSIQNMTWNGKLGFDKAPSEEVVITLPDLQWNATFYANGLGGYDGPGQGPMGTQHFERGLMYTTTYQCGHMQPQFQPRVAYRHLQWLLGRIDSL